jgi:hypothetical protein
MANYLEAESQLLATQKAEVAMRGAHMEDEMGGTGDPVLLNPLQILHAHEAELLQIQHQQQREELQTAYGLQDYEKFIVNNPGKSVHVYIDTVLKEETGKSRSQLNTEYAKRGASASADINGILIRKTGKSRSKLENAVLKIEKGKTKYFLRNEKLKNETGKSISQMRNKESRNKTGKSLDKLRDEKLMEETGKSRVEMRTEAKKSGKSYKEIYEASAQAYQRPFE